ncbi:glutamate synthase subunit beta [Puteibacter caeruleilacunae]|nr:glutamate synthase subunit beta [Puteibacter caeruleilacunae]
MGNPKAFIDIQRKEGGYRPVQERTGDFGEVEQTLNEKDRREQASRCMDCGVPFCHWACPVGSKMPEWQDAVYRGAWEEAYQILSSTNVMPEVTGRVCPALCEKSCVLAIHEEGVTIRENECATVERAFEMGIVKANPPKVRTGKNVAVIGSGPAGISAADQLNKAGHTVTVFEQDDAVGGLLRYGIPDFKLNKRVIDRRIAILEEEGIVFKTNTKVGEDVTSEELVKEFDAVLLAVGSMKPRDLPVEGRDAEGVYFAMEFLKQQNKVVSGQEVSKDDRINAKGKRVLVIGGGDTGSDCVGTSVRQKADKVTQIEILPKPPVQRETNNPWPYWPNVLRTSSSHKEGCERRWSLATKRFIVEDGKLTGAEVVEVEWNKGENGNFEMKEVEGTVEVIKADLVFLSMGFVHPIQEGLLSDLGVEFDARGNVKSEGEKTQSTIAKVFSAGDARMGASLVVRAIADGRNAANEISNYLKTL